MNKCRILCTVLLLRKDFRLALDCKCPSCVYTNYGPVIHLCLANQQGKQVVFAQAQWGSPGHLVALCCEPEANLGTRVTSVRLIKIYC